MSGKNWWEESDGRLVVDDVNEAVLELHAEVERLRDALPRVKGVCPACDTEHLFLGAGGYVTCGYERCPRPDLVSDLLIEGCPDDE